MRVNVFFHTLGLLLLILLPASFFLGREIMMQLYGINILIPYEIHFASRVDAVTTLVLVGTFVALNRDKINRSRKYWSELYDKEYVKYIYIINTVFLIIAVFSSLSVIKLIAAGESRQNIYDTMMGMPFLLQLADKYFLVLVSFILFTNVSFKLKAYTFFCFFVVTAIMTSRANIMFFAMVVYIVICLDFHRKDIVRLAYLVLSVVCLAILIGVVFQKRLGGSVFLGPFKPIEDLFLYQGYSLYLAQVSVEHSNLGSKYFFPFFGYFSEYFYRIFGGNHAVDSEFIMRFHVFNSDIRTHSANVVYPWWSWFYGAYGLLGLILKPIFSFLVLWFSLRKRFFPVFILILYWVLFTGPVKHPLITLDAYVMLFFAFFIAFFPRLKFRWS